MNDASPYRCFDYYCITIVIVVPTLATGFSTIPRYVALKPFQPRRTIADTNMNTNMNLFCSTDFSRWFDEIYIHCNVRARKNNTIRSILSCSSLSLHSLSSEGQWNVYCDEPRNFARANQYIYTYEYVCTWLVRFRSRRCMMGEKKQEKRTRAMVTIGFFLHAVCTRYF